MTRTSQVSDEMNAFMTFIAASRESIDPSTVKSLCPPAPDIECRYLDGKSIGFELVELLDSDFKRAFELQQNKVRAFYQYLDSMSVPDKQRFIVLYRNADILVNFNDSCPQGTVRMAVPNVFKELFALADNYDGLVDSFTTKGLEKAVMSISILRGSFCGPLFNAQAMGWVSDPCVTTIQNKLGKTYITPNPIELIAYIDGNPMFPEDVWKPTLDNYLKQLSCLTPFRKIWVLDLGATAIAYEMNCRGYR